jgi:hypothetical protein
MTISELRELIREWDLNEFSEEPTDTAKYGLLFRKLEFLGKNEWKYLPSLHPDKEPIFLNRLASWIGNVNNEADRKTLLEYANRIAFFSRDDFWSLYHSAFTGPIMRWVIETEKLRLSASDFSERLDSELYERTWFCPITDSMDINEFYHANHICGIKHRPAFASLAMLTGKDKKTQQDVARKIKGFLKKPNPAASAPSLKRIVLLEDFVGSGTQAAGALTWAAKWLNVKLLFLPLIICAPGVDHLSETIKKLGARVRMDTLITLEREDLVGPSRGEIPKSTFDIAIENLAEATLPAVAGGNMNKAKKAPFGPFGFKRTGCSAVTYSNCPNNSLPMIHHEPDERGWKPLFPRVSRM